MKTLKYNEFIKMNEVKKSEEQIAYQKFFKEKLDKYGVESQDELSDADMKKFFNEIKKEWKNHPDNK
jgi:hypothetical protein